MGRKITSYFCYGEIENIIRDGGVPRYLEEIDARLNAEDNIKNLCFSKGALLVDEFDRLFSSLFLRNSEFYKKIVNVLATGDKEFTEVCEALNTELSGRILEYLDELELSGFVNETILGILNQEKMLN